MGSSSNRWVGACPPTRVAGSGDFAGRIVSVPNVVSTRSYDARAQVLSITHGNGVVTSCTCHATRGWLLSTATMKSGTVLNAVIWTGYNSRRIKTIDETTPSVTGVDWAYTYDEAGRLTVADNTDGSRDRSFSYRPNGNMTVP